MKQLDLKITSKCNLNCKHCLIKDTIQNPVDMNTLCQIIDKEKPSLIHLGGGEPLLCDDIEKLLSIIETCKDTKFCMTSNLCLPLNDEMIILLATVDSLYTSFDLRIRFGNIHNLLLWRNNVRLLKYIGIHIGLIICITKDVVRKDIRKFKKFIDDMGFDEYKFVPLIGCKSGIDKKEFKSWAESMIDIEDDKNKTPMMMATNKFTSCYYIDSWNVYDGIGNKIHCEFSKDNNCNIALDCYACEYFQYCGGRCPQIECLYYDRDIDTIVKGKIHNVNY